MNMVWNGMDIYGPNLSFMMLQGKEMANALPRFGFRISSAAVHSQKDKEG